MPDDLNEIEALPPKFLICDHHTYGRPFFRVGSLKVFISRKVAARIIAVLATFLESGEGASPL